VSSSVSKGVTDRVGGIERTRKQSLVGVIGVGCGDPGDPGIGDGDGHFPDAQALTIRRSFKEKARNIWVER